MERARTPIPHGPPLAKRVRRAAKGLGALALALVLGAGGLVAEPIDPAERGRRARIEIESIEVAGNTRTPARVIIAASGLEPGHPVDSTTLLLAADRVRARSLVSDVAVRAKRGTEPGRVTVVFDVEEQSPHVRLGVGYEDLSGWYLIPLQLNLDNVSGRAEHADVSVRLGLRTAGLIARYRRSDVRDLRRYWEARARVEAASRLYFLGGTEVRHDVDTGGIDLSVGRPLSRSLALTGWLTAGSQEVESSATVHVDRDVADLEEGMNVPFEDLPVEIQRQVGSVDRTQLGVSLGLDTRRASGLRQSGWWGQTSLAVTRTSNESTFGEWHTDLRYYRPVTTGSQLAFRGRTGVVGADAPFTDRLYLGGLYTVRGYPSHSLAPTIGFTRTATASVEFRRAWTDGADPRVVGVLFADVGVGDGDGQPATDAASAGFGVRVRVPWVGHLGIDVGLPLSEGQVDEAFHVNGGIGWTY